MKRWWKWWTEIKPSVEIDGKWYYTKNEASPSQVFLTIVIIITLVVSALFLIWEKFDEKSQQQIINFIGG